VEENVKNGKALNTNEKVIKMISNKVMKTEEFDDAIYYRLPCSCGSKDHDITLEFEHDEEIPEMVFLNMYMNLAWSSYWGDTNFFQIIWRKIKTALRIIFVGYIQLEESFILKGEDHIDAFIEALEEGKQLMKKKGNHHGGKL
jgi:hypothetical protein